MTLSPRESAARGLQLLADRLEPIISRTLAPDLDGLSWTVLLTEIDRLKGKVPHTYTRNDVQAQLRVLTERLGNIGYPFDDHTRTVSTLGGELRIARNRISHMDDLTLLDAWRTLDFIVRLLAHFDDSEGSAEAESMRDSILRLTSPGAELTSVEDEVDEEAAETGPGEPEVVPDPEVYRRAETVQDRPRTSLRDERLEFEPWTVVLAGDVSALDGIRRQENRELVRSVIEEIVAQEGPIQMERLARLTGRAFGLGRVESKRVNQIKHQVKGTELTVDGDGWVWPVDMDPENWEEFRPSSSGVDRPFDAIAPQEVANASQFLRDSHPEDTEDEHRRRVLQTFGKKRMTTKVRQHLDRSLDTMVFVG
ncbi:DUF3320 domain-containing protein [Micrococcus sp. TA1]|uniref:DUF3320 domain-containing protein n=1 Tax=Micrococcus sp. TA1 TaxID=681627 RepID=UPI00160BAAB1|nr:DUF3320 domain-containing protein [Micrococcus sp. TA1]MBB5750110.1 hypothetical protein [Micrococcus sp. TA1]